MSNWNKNAAADVDALVKLARTEGTAEGKGGQALPNIALSFAAAAAAGHVPDIKEAATRIYKAYGEARNKSGTGKTINVDSDGAIKAPVSKLSAFARLASTNAVRAGSNMNVGQEFFDEYADKVDLWRGNHYERLYSAVAHQLRVIETESEPRLVEVEEIETLFVVSGNAPQTELMSLDAIIKALDVHVNGGFKNETVKVAGQKATKVAKPDPLKPAHGDSTGDIAKAMALLSAVKTKVERSSAKVWNKVEKNPNAFSHADQETVGTETTKEGTSRSFIDA